MNALEEVKLRPVFALPSIRKGILDAEEFMKTLPGAMIGDSPEYLEKCPLKHSFGDGCYIRELFMPKGMLFTSKIHKKTHPYFILKGDVSVLTEEGIKRVKAPFQGMTLIGTKRIIYTHEDTTWITVHVTKKKNLKKIEDEIIAKTYQEIGLEVDETKEKLKLLNFIEEVSKQEEKC